MDPQSLIAGYSKHTPKLLRRQILCELLKQYLDTPASSGDHGDAAPIRCIPSVQRFHGAMLFVDISGFTALSLRLDVETLKNHINMYFSKMLDIVEKWDGDVIKFAGDALFIIWPTAPPPSSSRTDNDSISRLSARNNLDSKHFTQAARRALEKAVACGLEISADCGNYEVKLTDSSGTSPSKAESTPGAGGGLVNKFLKLGSFLAGSRVAPGNDDVAYLDVHSGVSCGLMAGIDVVHGSRGEFFLVGEPLTGVAMAESQAMKGDVVLDVTAHDVLHGTKTVFTDEDGEEVIMQSPPIKQKGSGQQAAGLPCGCVCTPSGLFVVKKLITRVSKGGLERRKTRSQLKVELIQQRSEHHSLSVKSYEDIVQDVQELFMSSRPSMRKAFYQFLKSSGVGGKYSETTFSDFAQHHVKKHFEDNMHSALLEYATLHVHEVERRGLLSSGSNPKRRNSSFHEMMESSKHVLANFTSISRLVDAATHQNPVDTQTQQEHGGTSPKSKDSELDDESKLAERNKRRHRASISSFAAEVNNGEIRTIIVMFVKIERFDLRLKVDNFGKSAYSNRFAFLDRTESEQEADDALLSRFQVCFGVLEEAFQQHGGQMRQFIVDDKGTVCIGTFGLRGSTAVDNAASAMEASKFIIDSLKKFDLHAQIGITSGKAYCGLVGSSLRHEYAVMGPSTNLAARLMCKARLNSVICDADTADRDRTHKFDALQEIQAKGYSKPVMIYRPMFNHREDSFTMRHFRFPSSRNMAAVGAKKKKKRSLKAVVAMVTYTRMLSAKSIIPKQSFTERMIALCNTDFHISPTKAKQGATANERSVVTNKLFGRHRELVDVFQALFDDDAKGVHVLSTGHKMKIVVLCGVIGIGKGAMVNAIERKLQYLARADKTCPMAILRNRHNVMQKKDSPLGIWQVMIRKLFLSFRKTHLERLMLREELENSRAAAGDDAHAAEVPPLATANTLTSLEGDANFEDVIGAIRHLLPESLHSGLLLLLEWTSDEVALDYVSSLSNEDLDVLQQLIVHSVKAYVEIVKKFVLVIM